jgi:hypothetical protein
MANIDNEEVYNQHVITELTDEEVRKVDEWMDESDQDSIDYFFEQVAEYGAREAAKMVYILDEGAEEPAPGRKTKRNYKYIILSGNISEGFEAFGPFDTMDEASDKFPGPDARIMTLKQVK